MSDHTTLHLHVCMSVRCRSHLSQLESAKFITKLLSVHFSTTILGFCCSRSLKMASFDRLYTTFNWSVIVSILLIFAWAIQHIVTMAVSCIVLAIKRDIGRKSRYFFTPLVFDAPVRRGVSDGILTYRLVPDGEKSLRICITV